ncbi:hypothetical protein NDU88_006731 [Pleurodeles waltl]|uniref:SRCR domain-containing protein n=1 Tax=Pleurodeles waltl TaxID=8319 RepID=A0AAV7PJ80_PLEWA|nr:hypothetical protein NDU88_006731 [Pleurodeles waltl]
MDVAHVAGERAPAFTQEELERLVDGVLPLYAKLYGRAEVQVSAHQKRALWYAIAKEVRTLGVYNRWSTHCRKRWEDLRRRARKICEAQLGKSSQHGRGAHQALTPLMRRILAVAYPDLDGLLKAAQQSQGGLWAGSAIVVGTPLLAVGGFLDACVSFGSLFGGPDRSSVGGFYRQRRGMDRRVQNEGLSARLEGVG